MNLIPELQEYAHRLSEAGFRVYAHSGPGLITFLLYSQEVDGKTCFGSVQRANFGNGYEHHMPIRPSKENGSSMWVKDVPEDLSVEAARMVARPSNYNPLVGTQANWQDLAWLERGYIELTERKEA